MCSGMEARREVVYAFAIYSVDSSSLFELPFHSAEVLRFPKR